MEPAPGCWQKELATCFFVFHPTFQVADVVIDFFDGWEYFGKPSLEFWLVKVLPNGFVKFILTLDNGGPELLQLLNAFLGCRLSNFPTVLPLLFENSFNVICVYFFHVL